MEFGQLNYILNIGRSKNIHSQISENSCNLMNIFFAPIASFRLPDETFCHKNNEFCAFLFSVHHFNSFSNFQNWQSSFEIYKFPKGST